jgi:hypothetical protein
MEQCWNASDRETSKYSGGGGGGTSTGAGHPNVVNPTGLHEVSSQKIS